MVPPATAGPIESHVQCRGFESYPRQLIVLRKSDCLGCAVLLCLIVCLTLLASLFLPSHLSLKHVCATTYIRGKVRSILYWSDTVPRYQKNKLASPVCIAFSTIVDCAAGSGGHTKWSCNNTSELLVLPFYRKRPPKFSP